MTRRVDCIVDCAGPDCEGCRKFQTYLKKIPTLPSRLTDLEKVTKYRNIYIAVGCSVVVARHHSYCYRCGRQLDWEKVK